MATDADEPKASPPTEEADLLDEPEEESESLLVSISRRMGQMTRQVKDLSDAIARRRERVPRRRAEPPLDTTLKKLAELMKKHEAAGYITLAKEDEFWNLVTTLSRIGLARRLERNQSARKPLRIRTIRTAVPEAAIVPAEPAKPAAPAPAKDAAKPAGAAPEPAAAPATEPAKAEDAAPTHQPASETATASSEEAESKAEPAAKAKPPREKP